MCGICGKFNFDLGKNVEEELVRCMTRALYRRGPDDERFFFSGHVGLGVRRLSIMDLEKGQQPFYNENKSVCVIYNGEIYNHEDLRTDLFKLGHVFKTKCDGEVIAHLYEESADHFLERLHGMFALAIYDQNKKRLVIARDRMGIKPIYYCSLSGYVLFSSSLRTLLLDPGVSNSLDPEALHCYLAYNYYPGDLTPFVEICKLLPGHCLIVDRQGVRLQQYWAVPYRESSDARIGFCGERFHEIFKRTVKRYLSADVPVGVFLSGGLDSSYLAYTATEVRGKIDTFTIGFREKSFDERKFARQVSSSINSNHYEIEIPSDIVPVIQKVIKSSDVPIGEPSLIPTFELSAFVKQYCGVALSGEGADELFWGYDTYRADQWAGFLYTLPLPVRTAILDGLARLVPRTASRMGLRFILELISRVSKDCKERMHYGWREVFSLSERQQLCSSELGGDRGLLYSADTAYDFFRCNIKKVCDKDYLDRANLFDLKVWLPDSVLHRVDMASMYHGLEVRVPFLDDDILNLVATLPRSVFFNNFKGKYSIKKMLKARLPDSVLNRPKQGFSVPVSLWLRDNLAPFYNDVLSRTSGRCGQLLRYDYVRRLLLEHCNGHQDHGRRLWNALMFILWYDSLNGIKQ